MAFKLWFKCPHRVFITPDGTWHQGECKRLNGINPNDVLVLEPEERLALERAPVRCSKCYPTILITGGPVE